jgi:hypothetical protein
MVVGENSAKALIYCICDSPKELKRNFALGVCWTYGLPFATPCKPAAGNSRPTE